MNHKQRTDSGTSMPADLKYRQSGSGQTGRGAQNGQLDGEPGHHGQAGASPAQAATWNLSEQLNFAEFLQRQQSHLEVVLHCPGKPDNTSFRLALGFHTHTYACMHCKEPGVSDALSLGSNKMAHLQLLCKVAEAPGLCSVVELLNLLSACGTGI